MESQRGKVSERPTMIGTPGFDRPTLLGDTTALAASEQTLAADLALASIGPMTAAAPSGPAAALASEAPPASVAPSSRAAWDSLGAGLGGDASASAVAPGIAASRGIATSAPTEVLVLVEREGKVLLGLKTAEINGVGSVIHASPRAGEALRETAIRATREACHVTVKNPRLLLVAHVGSTVHLGFLASWSEGEAEPSEGWEKWAWLVPSHLPIPIDPPAASMIAALRNGVTFLDIGPGGTSTSPLIERAALGPGLLSSLTSLTSPSSTEGPRELEPAVPPKNIVVESLFAGLLGAGGVLLTLGVLVQGVEEASIWGRDDVSKDAVLALAALSWPLATYFGFDRPAPTRARLAIRAGLTLVFGGFASFCLAGFLLGVIELRHGAGTLALAVIGAGLIALMRFLGGRPRSKDIPVRLAFATAWFTVAFVALFAFSSSFRHLVDSPTSHTARRGRY